MSGRTPDEVVVVGGGPVGLATAIAARARGLAVRVIDFRRPPIDKACGEGLMPDGVAWLATHGVSVPPEDSFRFTGIRYVDGGEAAEARFAGAAGLGVRRPVLHAALVRRAEAAGVELEWGTRVLGLEVGAAGRAGSRGSTAPDGAESAAGRSVAAIRLETSAGVREARWVVGADGLRSRVRRWAGLEGAPTRSLRRFGTRRHYGVPPWTDVVEVHWAESCEAYVTPVSPREVGVAMLWSGDRRGVRDCLPLFPALERRLAGAAVTTRDRGAGPLRQRPRAAAAGRVALVGDAAGYLDAITGEGMALGFHQAEALAEALAAGDLRLYRRAVRRLVALPFALIRALLFAERHPALRRRLVRTLRREPELFARLLAVHARQAPPRSVGLGGVWRLVRGAVGP